MKKCIYKITNLLNNKVYIGQTNDFTRRVREHKNFMYGNCDKYLYNSIKKYGIENFKFEIIEDYCEDYNEKERYWINYYHSNNSNYGYNIDLEIANQNHNSIHLSNTDLQNIYSDLRNTELSFEDIAIKYNIKAAQSIRDINRGITYHDPEINYPIRLMRNDIAKERAIKIINDLKNTNLKIDQIAKKYNCAETTVSNINTGSRIRFDDEEYPIRKNTRKGQYFTPEIINNMYDDIINTNLTWEELAQKYHCNTKVFQHINRGQLHKKEGYSYPLRKSSLEKVTEQIPQIISDLKYSSLSQKQIADKYHIGLATISNINRGLSHVQENESYPIRK